jgi:hypothetical protein
MSVVDQDDERVGLRGVGHQRQHREADQESIGRRPSAQTEGDAERITLRRGQPLDAVEKRHTELMQGRIRQFQLRPDTGGPQDPASGCASGRKVEERGLPDAGLTAHDQDAAPPLARGGKQLVDSRTLHRPTAEHRRWRVCRPHHVMRVSAGGVWHLRRTQAVTPGTRRARGAHPSARLDASAAMCPALRLGLEGDSWIN